LAISTNRTAFLSVRTERSTPPADLPACDQLPLPSGSEVAGRIEAD
jgi:hypothetical protein